MRLELHLLITGSQKGSKASSRGGKSEEACEIVSLVLQHHRNDVGEAEEIAVEELLPEEEAQKASYCAVLYDYDYNVQLRSMLSPSPKISGVLFREYCS